MHIYLAVYITYCVASAANAGLCDPETIKYNIGQVTPILDVPAEDISQMRQSCQKIIIIPGAREAWLSVEKAEFGSNKAYAYNGLVGTRERLIFDKILVQFGNCSPVNPAMELTIGFTKKFSSSSLCLKFKPEREYRSLGAHVPGGRVKLNVRVDTGICRRSRLHIVTSKNGPCQPLCNASTALNNCEKGAAHASTASTETTETAHESTVSTETTEPLKATEMQSWTQATSTEHRTTILYTTNSSIIPTATSVASIQTSTFAYMKTPSQSTEATPPSTLGNQHTPETSIKKTSRKFPITLPSRTGITLPENTSELTIPHNLTTIPISAVTHRSTNSEENITTQSSAETEPSREGNQIFGLLEGLYVIAGCIVLLLFIGVLAFLIRKRRIYSSSGGSNTGSAHRNGLHWRDNWLVRYHNNEIEGDSISQLDGDIHRIHGNFLNQSNAELHHIHHSGFTDVIKNKSSEDPYDNPWPLVRLDSDFVKNTRSLERERSAVDKNVMDEQEHKTGEMAAHDRNEKDERDTESNGKPKQNDTVNDSEKVFQNKHHFSKHIGSPMIARGQYNIAKVERSNSKNSFKNSQRLSDFRTDLNHKDHKRTKSESHLNHVESNKKKGSRQRNSSSMCSEYSPTFEEMLKDEIHNIEDALDMNCNVDTESNGSDRDIKKNWRVSTLYAIVSSKNGITPQDIVVTRKPSHKRHNSEVKRSESCKKIDDSGSKSKQIIRASSRTTSFQQERNISQKRRRTSAELPDVSGNESYPESRQFEDKRLNGTNKYSRPDYSDNQLPEASARSETADVQTRDTHESKIRIDSVRNKYKLETVNNDHKTRSTFQQNRDKFEQNGSIKQDSRPNSGASGTGQFPK